MFVILDEAVIRRPVGGRDVWRAQLGRLLELVGTPSTLAQVLPLEHGEHALMGGSLTLLAMAGGATAAYEESITTGTLIEDPDAVRDLRRDYDPARAYALPPRATAALLRDAMEALVP